MSKPSERSRKPRLAFLRVGVRSVLGGQISVQTAVLEYVRRCKLAISRRRERRTLEALNKTTAHLTREYSHLSASDLLKHFRERQRPSFLPGFEAAAETGTIQQQNFPVETLQLIESARLITDKHRWPFMGFGEMDFGDRINWNRDPLSRRIWTLEFHADLALWHNDGSDIRVLWEMNRLGHLITLGRAYAVTNDERFAEEFFSQLESWREQNPVGRGANWCCAMEVALRATNLLAAFTLFRASSNLTEDRLIALLAMLDQHGAHIARNLEFSHVITSNHYLSDLVGLLWLGVALPELNSAMAWRSLALTEIKREMDKQILPDGADYEASTGYHRLMLELILYSFVLCRTNDIEIEERYWQKLHAMLAYLRAILRPDGFAPLIGDTDGGQVLPISWRAADDHGYLLTLGAAVFHDSTLKLSSQRPSEELLWVLGAAGIKSYESLPCIREPIVSQAFPDSGTYVLRHEDLFLLFNAGGSGMRGRGSHGHNDALAIEVSACGRAFLVDPSSYVYTASLSERQLFRSTAYHSTLQVDDVEQNVTDEGTPFSIGDEAHPHVLHWESNEERDTVAAEHKGYERLAKPVRHRRKIIFEKAERWWFIEDELLGEGEHTVKARFHFSAGLDIERLGENSVVANDKTTGARLVVCALNVNEQPHFEPRFSSRHYGSKSPSISACWTIKTTVPCTLHWAIVPLHAGENEVDSLIRAAEFTKLIVG